MRGLLRRLRDRDPFVTLPLGVAVVIVVVVVVAVVAGQPPSVATAEKRAARAASEQHGLPLVAACSTPTRTGYVCRVRDASGRRGWWSLSRSIPRGKGATTEDESGEFPVLDPRGVRADVLVPVGGQSLDRLIDAAVVAGSLAAAPGSYALVACPAPTGGAPVPCAVNGPGIEASLEELYPGAYRFTTRWRLDP